jgi:hypothetical protein
MSLLKEGKKTGACLLGRKSWRKDWVFLIQTKFTCLGKGYNERFVYFLIARHASINSHSCWQFSAFGPKYMVFVISVKFIQ